MTELPSKKEIEKKLSLTKEPLEYNKDKNNLKINYIEEKENIIIFEFLDIEQIPCVNYIKIMNLSEIKELNKLFTLFKTCNEFFDYLKSLSKDKKINLKKSKDKITIILFIDVLYKKEQIKIDLIPEKKEFELRMNKKNKEIEAINSKNDFYIKEKNKLIDNLKKQIEEYSKQNEQLKEQNKKINAKNKSDKYKFKITFSFDKCLLFTIIIILLLLFILSIMFFYLKIEKNELNKKIDILNKIINDNILQKNLEFNQSLIMKQCENNFIFSEIQNKMNKPIKKIKKLYQATIDGADPIYFHSKCDNIPNTLVLIKSENNKRFGGFTPIPWKSKDGYLKDNENKTFVFSLDNKKIYNLKAVYHDEQYGPCFGYFDEITIGGNPIEEKCLEINQNYFDYRGDKQALSEYNDNNHIKALEYEVFHIIFY